MIRRHARETVLQVLFQLDMSGEAEPEPILARWAAEFALAEASLGFARELLLGTLANKAEIDVLLARLSEGWPLERMANVDRSILRLAAYEILQRPDIPGRVSLNEAIELAKRFSGEESAKFINGILDRLLADSPKGVPTEKTALLAAKTSAKGRKGNKSQHGRLDVKHAHQAEDVKTEGPSPN